MNNALRLAFALALTAGLAAAVQAQAPDQQRGGEMQLQKAAQGNRMQLENAARANRMQLQNAQRGNTMQFQNAERANQMQLQNAERGNQMHLRGHAPGIGSSMPPSDTNPLGPGAGGETGGR